MFAYVTAPNDAAENFSVCPVKHATAHLVSVIVARWRVAAVMMDSLWLVA